MDISLTNYLNIDFKVKFSKGDFNNFLNHGTKMGILLGALALLFSFLMTIYKCINPINEYARSLGTARKLMSFIMSLFYACVAIVMFLLSLPVFTGGVGQPVPDLFKDPMNQIPQEWLHQSRSLHIVGSYGLFRRMTGVGGRPEVIIEGSDNAGGPWKEYHFMYKPGNVTQSPPGMFFHQARLDWQLWFAALGNYQQNPWFISFLQRILDNEKDVLKLLDSSKNPFPKRAPKFLRSKLYKYHFSTEFSQPNWWTRELVGEYSPMISKDDPPAIREYLKSIGILNPPHKNQKSTNKTLARFLKYLRTQTIQPHHYLVLGLIIVFFSCFYLFRY